MAQKLQIALLCAAVAGNAAAAYLAVTPDRAADYIFTIPTHTNHICGKVIDPDHPYGVIRSEDVCWTWEALEERAAIADGAVPAARVSHVQGARVRKEHTEFESRMSQHIGDWLDPDAPLIGIYPVVYEAVGERTNTWTLTEGVYGYTNSLTVISMPMTNGTFSAYTNDWSALTVTGMVDTTRHESDATHMLGPDMLPLPLATNITFFVRSHWAGTGPIFDTELPRAHVFKEMFKWLRATQRLDDPMIFATNRVQYVYQFRYADGSTSQGTTTSSTIAARYSCTPNTWASYDYPASFKLYGDSRFTSAIVTTGGVRRVEIEAAYLLIHFEYEDTAYPGNGTRYEYHNGRVAARLQTFELDTSGERAVVVATVTPEYLREAGPFAYNLRAMPTGDYLAPVGHLHSWYSIVEGLAVVYKVTPSARFVSIQEGTP